MRKMRFLTGLMCILLCLTGCVGTAETVPGTIEVEYKKKDLKAEWSEADAVTVEFSGGTAAVSGPGAQMVNGVLVVTDEGDYVLKGEFAGRIVIDAEDEDVRLILNGVSISSAESAAVFVLEADKATLTLAGGSENRIVSGGTLIEADGEELDAAVYSKDDLVINGGGWLTVESPAGHGILSKDDLRVIGGNITVRSAKDGLRGRDAFLMYGGSVNIISGGDGIQSNNDEDADEGYISIDGGEVVVEAAEDGIQAETALQVRGGKVSIKTGEGSGDMSSIMAGASSSDTSQKGLKAGTKIIVTGGEATVDAQDDAVHSDGSVFISGGVLTLNSADDGVHAESELTVTGGKLSVLKAYEGLEGLDVVIADGEVSVVAADDGINAAGGNDGDSGEWKNPFAAGDHEIRISGGVVYVNALGDGVDSNGSFRVEGGEVYVSGPTDHGNGALDASGEMTMSGGVLLAAGSTGMASAPQADGQVVTMIYTTALQPGGKPVSIRNGAGEELAAFTPDKEWSSIVVSVPGVEEGEELQLYVDGELIETASAGEGAGTGGMRGHGGKGRR